MPKYDNSDRLDTVTDKEWREALDKLTAYLKWRLKGRTKWGAHSEKVLETPALDYYTEEAVAKLLEGNWKWQDRYSLAEQLIEIAGNLVTKQAEKYAREHPAAAQSEELQEEGFKFQDSGFRKKPEFIELMDPDKLPDCIDPSTSLGLGEDEMDETYEMVMKVVSDDEELTLYVKAIRECGHLDEIPEFMGVSMRRVYRLQEKLMRRVRRSKVLSSKIHVSGVQDEDSDEGKKRMKFIDKIYMFEAERKSAEENYKAFGTTREEHQARMLEFIHKKLEEVKGERKK